MKPFFEQLKFINAAFFQVHAASSRLLEGAMECLFKVRVLTKAAFVEIKRILFWADVDGHDGAVKARSRG